MSSSERARCPRHWGWKGRRDHPARWENTWPILEVSIIERAHDWCLLTWHGNAHVVVVECLGCPCCLGKLVRWQHCLAIHKLRVSRSPHTFAGAFCAGGFFAAGFLATAPLAFFGRLSVMSSFPTFSVWLISGFIRLRRRWLRCHYRHDRTWGGGLMWRTTTRRSDWRQSM